MGNNYSTTIHVINSAINKLSNLTKAAKVYRGLTGFGMPEQLVKESKYKVRL